MKIKNIAFSGFAAAILASGAAVAADGVPEIASKAYVDRLGKTVSETYLTTEIAGDTYLTKNDATTTYVQTTQLGDEIKTVLDNEESDLAKEFAAIDGRVTQNTTDIDGLTTRVDAAETKIGTDNLTTTAQNIVAAINELKTKTDSMPTEGNLETINDKITALETAVGDAESGIKKDVADNAAAIEILNGDAETEGSVAHAVSGTIPKPEPGDCAGADLCVLSVKPDGTLAWTGVTSPVE